ncbi:YicC family protein [Jannaschia sp. Os4]|nr:YicC family protein [Jannaschia sp. Os4]
MTGYAALDRPGRRWEMRSVNGRGADLRFRLAEVEGLEATVRARLKDAFARGNVTVALRLGQGGGTSLPSANPDALAAAAAALAQAEEAADAAGVRLAPSTAADLLGLRGVWDAREDAEAPDLATLKSDLEDLVAAWDADRAREGTALRATCAGHVDEIAALRARAASLVGPRSADMASAFRAALARVEAAGMEPERVAQEVAALAVRADVAEELDRLAAHVDAARALLAEDAPVGRRLDFLTQEFNREANTLCAKSQHAEMTAVGLDLKAVIDRLREQVQNIE